MHFAQVIWKNRVQKINKYQLNKVVGNKFTLAAHKNYCYQLCAK